MGRKDYLICKKMVFPDKICLSQKALIPYFSSWILFFIFYHSAQSVRCTIKHYNFFPVKKLSYTIFSQTTFSRTTTIKQDLSLKHHAHNDIHKIFKNHEINHVNFLKFIFIDVNHKNKKCNLLYGSIEILLLQLLPKYNWMHVGPIIIHFIF